MSSPLMLLFADILSQHIEHCALSDTGQLLDWERRLERARKLIRAASGERERLGCMDATAVSVLDSLIAAMSNQAGELRKLLIAQTLHNKGEKHESRP